MIRPRRARRVLLALAAVVVALPALPAPAGAWDDVGHMTVASIAWQRLTPGARARAVALLRAAPPDAGLTQLRPNSGGPEARDRALFVRAATWADLVKDRREAERFRRYHHAGWHYANTYWRLDASGRAVEVPGLADDGENVVERIDALSAAVRDERRPPADRAIALAWLLHLVGDVHQPLHASSRVTARQPEGDRGGNGVRLGSTNLHAVWDDAMDRSPGRRPGAPGGRRQGADAKLGRAEEWAARLARAFPADRWRVSVAEPSPARWARESLVLAQRHAYAGIADSMPAVPAGYRERVRRTAEPQVTLAGYRLAVLLERVLGSR
jgi:hypothetical protein